MTNALGAANEFVGQAQGEFGVRSSSFDTSLGGVFRNVLGCQECVAILVLSRS